MIGSGYGNVVSAECGVTPERELERVDIEIEGIRVFKNALKNFLNSDVRHMVLDNKEEHNAQFALYGALSIFLPRLLERRHQLIERIEKIAAERPAPAPAPAIVPKFEVEGTEGIPHAVGFYIGDNFRMVASFDDVDSATKYAEFLNGK